MTGGLSNDLQKLDDFLFSEAVGEDSMFLSELDGFLAGVVVCPDLIPPSDWIPVIWGEEAPVFEDQEQAKTILDIVMNHYNGMIAALDRGKYQPIYDFDDHDILWELWMEGFWRAMRLRPEAWRRLAKVDDDELQQGLFVLSRLGELATMAEEARHPMDIDEELEKQAPDLIPAHVEILHHARKALAPSFSTRPTQQKRTVGRNDPCPCGSGKKYKKCYLN